MAHCLTSTPSPSPSIPVVDIVDNTVNTNEDTAVTFNALTNDSFEGSPVISVVTQGTNGSVSIGSGGS